MDVNTSDGQRTGTVDHMRGSGQIKPTKAVPAAHGEHHVFPLARVGHVDEHVHISKPGQEAVARRQHQG